MISADFAPNEYLSDALTSLITVLWPFDWYRGNALKKVKKKLTNMFPGTHPVLFLSGRSALSFLLSTLSVSHQDEVAVAGFTCEAVTLPIIYHKLKPVYIDIEQETYSLDITDLEKKITSKTKAIILQHTYGIVPKWRDRVLQIARDKKIVVIEDLAHGFNPSFWQNIKLSANQALLVSFGRSKALSSVFGGSVITSNTTWIDKLNKIEANLSFPEYSVLIRFALYKPISYLIRKTYNLLFIGKLLHFITRSLRLIPAEISEKERRGSYDTYLDKKYPNLLAKLLICQLHTYTKRGEQRKKIVSFYNSFFNKNYSGFLTRYPLLIKNKHITLNDVSKQNVFLGSWYSQPVAPVGLNLEKVGYAKGSCPTAESVCSGIINLPTLVTKKQALTICNLLPPGITVL